MLVARFHGTGGAVNAQTAVFLLFDQLEENLRPLRRIVNIHFDFELFVGVEIRRGLKSEIKRVEAVRSSLTSVPIKRRMVDESSRNAVYRQVKEAVGIESFIELNPGRGQRLRLLYFHQSV